MGQPDEILLMVEAKSRPSFSTRIHRAPEFLKRHGHYYFMPRMFSVGPYHHQLVNLFDDIKYALRDMLVDKKTLEILYDNLAGMVKQLRGYYEEDGTSEFSDEEFTNMMVLDGCFILSFIKQTLGDYRTRDVSYSYFVTQECLGDIFLLENQIPYQVLNEVMKLVPDDSWELKINRFIDAHFLVTEKGSVNDRVPASTSHLFELLQTRITEKKGWSIQVGDLLASSCTVRKLTGQGLRVRPNTSGSLACISLVKNWFFWSYLELPPITLVEFTTECLLYNLAAQETYVGAPWITMYLYLLASLIDNDEDVTILLKAGVLNNLLGTVEEVLRLFRTLKKFIKPCPLVKSVIHNHYDGKGSLKVKHE